jgi:hypothetical protein
LISSLSAMEMDIRRAEEGIGVVHKTEVYGKLAAALFHIVNSLLMDQFSNDDSEMWTRYGTLR